MYIMGCEQAGNRRSSLLNRRYQLSQPKVCSTTDLFFSKTKPWVCCGRKTTWIIHPQLSITDLKNGWSLSPPSTSDQIQPWNPLSHLVDRKREPVCSLHVQEHLLLWPPRAALIKVSLAFLRNFLRRYRDIGDIAANRKGELVVLRLKEKTKNYYQNL